jgi:hypothetical protein
MFRLVAASLLFPATTSALKWVRHLVPLSGTLVLTDVHAMLDGDRIVALATGEGGVLLKLDVNASAPPAGSEWQVLSNPGVYWYGAYVFSASSFLVSGFVDGGGVAYGVVSFSDDGGVTWSADKKIDPCSQAVCAWGGGPIEFANALEGYMPSTSGQSAWRTQAGGRNASEWKEIVPSAGNWHAGNYVYDGNGFIAIAGSNDCNSSDFAETWSCFEPVDASGLDSGIACGGSTCVIGGGEISPDVLGWLHVSHDGGRTYAPQRALQAPYPVRTLQVVASVSSSSDTAVDALDAAPSPPPVLVAAGGNFFSGVGGVFSSIDGGKNWTQDVDLGEEVKACRSLPLPAQEVTRVFCVSAGASGGSILSADVPMRPRRRHAGAASNERE